MKKLLTIYFLIISLVYGSQTIGLKNWSHPTKQVFLEQSLNLYKVILENKTYPIFYVNNNHEDFNFYDYIFLSKLAGKNGYWNFEIIINNDFFKVYCNKKNKRVTRIESEKKVKEFDDFTFNEASKKAKEIIAQKDKLLFINEKEAYYEANTCTYLLLKEIDFDEEGRFEIRVSPKEYPLSVYNYYHIDLRTREVFEE